MTIAALGRALGTSETRARAFTDGTASINLRHLMAAPAAVRREIARALMAIDAPVPVGSPCPHRNMTGVVREIGQVAEAIEAAGEHRDEAEKARIRREIHDVRERLDALEASL